jgi:hypothetical protein
MSIIERIVNISTNVEGKPMFDIPDIKNKNSEIVEEEIFGIAMSGDGHLFPKEAQGIVTDIVIDEFLKESDKMFNFMKTICILFNDSIEYYCEKMQLNKTVKEGNKYVLGDIYFMYKGGNVLRLLFNEFRKNLSNKVSNIAKNRFANFFKKSDSDFSIIINPDLPNYELVYNDMIRLSYIIQKLIRDKIFNKTPKGDGNDVFSYIEYNDAKKQVVLKKAFEDIKSMNSVLDPENDLFYQAQILKVKVFSDSFGNNGYRKEETNSSKKDLILDILNKKSPNGDRILGTYFYSDDKYVYPISINKGLDFIRGSDENPIRVKFALVRTKLNLEVTFNRNGTEEFKNIGGELIDCTVMHRLTHNLNTIEKFEKGKNKMTHYTLSNGSDNIVFYGYNLDGLIKDLELILFIDKDKPWEDLKYKKRINRLFFLYMVDLFEKIKTLDKRKELIDKFRTDIINGINLALREDKLNTIDLTLGSAFDSEYAITNIIKYLVNITQIISKNNPQIQDKDEFIEMMNTIEENTKYINEIINGMMDYVKDEAKYDMAETDFDINSL